jgi:hydroxymethylbilane synthase
VRVRLATRGSPLARWQADHVASLLLAAQPGLEVELVVVTTTGDRRADVPVVEMGGQGVFVREVQAAVAAGRADAAVHSAKDLQPVPTPGLRLAAVPPREDARDALVGRHLADLAPGSVVATGSQRRRAQLAWLRPDLAFEDLRGNIATRLAKVPPGGAVVVAVAALVRLGLLDDVASEVLTTDVMLPQVAQGALAVECRDDDGACAELLAQVEDPVSRRLVDAERAFLAAIGGSCDLPVAAHATVLETSSELRLEGLLASPDGKVLVRRSATGPLPGPGPLGKEVAELVLEAGGQALLSSRWGRV